MNSYERGELIYKFRVIYREGEFGDIKETQEFKQSNRGGLYKSGIVLKLGAIVSNFKKIDKHLNKVHFILKKSKNYSK